MKTFNLRITFTTGPAVITALVALTAIEFLIAMTVERGLVSALIPVVIAKSWLIANYFMHIQSLWRQEE